MHVLNGWSGRTRHSGKVGVMALVMLGQQRVLMEQRVLPMRWEQWMVQGTHGGMVQQKDRAGELTLQEPKCLALHHLLHALMPC